MPSRGIERIAGLDGLRGLAVLAVVVFHIWPAQVPGGFIGVSIFFALSGFLISSIILREVETTGSLSLRRFSSRRARRLMPVSLATLTAIAVGWSLAGWLTADFRRDLYFALAQLANWGHVLARQRYGVDAAASPVLHYWSLAIEEQLYLLLPLTLMLCRRRRWMVTAVVVGLLGSIVAIWAASDSPVLSYYSTFTRAGELLVGALAALVLRRRMWTGRAARCVAAVVSIAGIVMLTWVVLRLDVSDPWFRHGGMLVCATVATAIIVAVSGVPRLGRLLDWFPLARLGQISYAVYLFHWPLLQTFRRAGMADALVPWATIAATLALALLSERWLERPVRSGAVKGRRLAVASATTAVLVLFVGAVGVSEAAPGTDFEAAAADFNSVVAANASTTAAGTNVGTTTTAPVVAPSPTSSTTSTTIAPPPVRIGFFGDSKALDLGLGTARGGFTEIQVATSYTTLGCPTGRAGAMRATKGATVYEPAADCDWTNAIADVAARFGGLDAAVVWSGTRDIADRKVPALGNTWMNVTDPAYRAWLLTEMVALNDTIVAATGARKVLWLTLPEDPNFPHPERFAAWTALLHDLQAQRPDEVTIIDIAAYIAASGDAQRLLPDGLHPSYGEGDPTVNSGAELTRALILPEVIGLG